MIDTEDTMRSFDPTWQAAGSGRVTLAVQCADPAEVDRLHDELAELGAGSHLAPFDAFWGQRYATVLDPDRIRVDLYAEIPAPELVERPWRRAICPELVEGSVMPG